MLWHQIRLRGDNSRSQRPLCATIAIILVCAAFLNQTDAQHRGRQDPIRDETLRKQYIKEQSCDMGSCYPATGNLLIGRENRLEATSTCGLRGPERFCIVSHLEEKKCFLCDTSPATVDDPLKNHRIGQIIYTTKRGTRIPTWWQSENGLQNVSITLELEAEFHFTHLIIVFATFRPAAMLIERSYDFGKTWHVYRYFAHDCHESFPGIPTVLRNITDIVCDSRYSSVEPSKNGEVIFRVLPPNIKVENPYALHVQNMLKMTNLRINFTRLHNLGDTLLDDRHEIQEKYYYGISNMVVRGSCSCYGHASRCLPLDGTMINEIDMVHGRCECTHNTKGLNCETCEDFYNDLPWNPAFGKQSNACKRCECNNHATSCHFDEAVYEHSGRISGGVCDNCLHNTQGQHCEECIPFFYRDPREDIQSPYACRPCDCDPTGALDEGICDSVNDPENGIEAGACHCRINVKGRRCDQCKEGFWNLTLENPDGCQPCTCNTLGTIDNFGCNTHTGECTCKRLVTGKDCNQCAPETFGLSEADDGCTQCNCHPGGSFNNFCDVISGQCSCRPHMTGRTCSTPIQNYYIPQLHIPYEAETQDSCIMFTSNGTCLKIYYPPPEGDRRADWTGPGLVRIPEHSEITFSVGNIPNSMPYDIVIRYHTQTRGDWEDAYITLLRPDEIDLNGPCAGYSRIYETQVPFTLPQNQRDAAALKAVCLEAGKIYTIRIRFERHRQDQDDPTAQILIDSLVLAPQIEATAIFKGTPMAENRLREYHNLGCDQSYYNLHYDIYSREQCKEFWDISSTLINNGALVCNCNPTGSLSKQCDPHGGSCQCKTNIVGRQCDVCAPGTYAFGPEGCKACDCNSIGAKDNNCDPLTGQCACHPNTYGRECNQCQPGYWNFPHCQICECNGHAQQCDSETGQCLNCMDFTTGYNCNSCLEGYYGDPFLGSDIGCRPCRCPDTMASGNSHATSCDLDRRNNNMICRCKEGYHGDKCEVCAENFFGDPEMPGGECIPCECSNNIDPYNPGNCDKSTGKCLNCLYDTTGDHCEFCKDGFYGDALQQRCMRCNCNPLGTNGTIQHCDRFTGQCPCLKNVEGAHCDQCLENHWKIASGEGCEPCACDPFGSLSEQCHPYDGQCTCKEGFGGRQCNQCQTGYYGNPNIECHPCQCNPHGSADYQCDRESGNCICHQGIGGKKCDECARGYLGDFPYCSPCGECFNNWDLILTNLGETTNATIEKAKQIKLIGATGAYTSDFNSLDKKIQSAKNLLSNTSVNAHDVAGLDKEILDLTKKLDASNEKYLLLENTLEDVYSNSSLSAVQVESLQEQIAEVNKRSKDMKDNGIQLQEANIEGALNLTKNAYEKVLELSTVKDQVLELNSNIDRNTKRLEALVNKINEDAGALASNEKLLADYNNELKNVSGSIPELNNNVCDKRGDPCDSLCGGAGCGSCGGLSCEAGALTRTEKALKISKDAEEAIKEKKEVADQTIRSLFQAKVNASEAYAKAKNAFDDAKRTQEINTHRIETGEEAIQLLDNYLNNQTALPKESKELAEKTLQLDLKLDPQEINKLGGQINEAVASLSDVEAIIENTRADLERVNDLKLRANATKTKASEALKTANDVVNNLNDAELLQKTAQGAIDKAKSYIELAIADLDEIDEETKTSEVPVNNTVKLVEDLAKKVLQLKKNITRNEIDAKEIDNEALEIKKSADEALANAVDLRASSEKANKTLVDSISRSEIARERAKKLLQRASKLTVDINEKLKELAQTQDIYDQNEERLDRLRNLIKPLNEEMSMHLSNIQTQADRFKNCVIR